MQTVRKHPPARVEFGMQRPWQTGPGQATSKDG